MRGVPPHPPAHAHPPAADAQAVADAERSGQSFLLFAGQDGRHQLFLFAPESNAATVGRRSSSDVALSWDDQVSRTHARFERTQDGWVLVDDGLSSNGTFVNGQRLSGRCLLSDGDRLRFGATNAVYRAPQLQRAPAPQPLAPAPQQRPPASQPAVALSTNQRRVLVALCRPYKGRSGFASPATDDQIAEDLFLSAGEVRGHLRVLYAKLGIEPSSLHETRVRLVERAFSDELVTEGDL